MATEAVLATPLGFFVSGDGVALVADAAGARRFLLDWGVRATAASSAAGFSSPDPRRDLVLMVCRRLIALIEMRQRRGFDRKMTRGRKRDTHSSEVSPHLRDDAKLGRDDGGVLDFHMIRIESVGTGDMGLPMLPVTWRP